MKNCGIKLFVKFLFVWFLLARFLFVHFPKFMLNVRNFLAQQAKNVMVGSEPLKCVQSCHVLT